MPSKQIITLFRKCEIWDGPQHVRPAGPWQFEYPKFAEAVETARFQRIDDPKPGYPGHPEYEG